MGKHAKKGGKVEQGNDPLLNVTSMSNSVEKTKLFNKVLGILNSHDSYSKNTSKAVSDTGVSLDIMNAAKTLYDASDKPQEEKNPISLHGSLSSDKLVKALKFLNAEHKVEARSFPEPTNVNIAKFMMAYYTGMQKDAQALPSVPKITPERLNNNVTEVAKRVSEALYRLLKDNKSSTILSQQAGSGGQGDTYITKEMFIKKFFKESEHESAGKFDDKTPLTDFEKYTGCCPKGIVGELDGDSMGGEDPSKRLNLDDLAGGDVATKFKWNPSDETQTVTLRKGDNPKKVGKFTKNSGIVIDADRNPVRENAGKYRPLATDLDKITALDIILAEMAMTTFGGKRKTKKAKKSRKSRKSRKARKSRKGGKC